MERKDVFERVWNRVNFDPLDGEDDWKQGALFPHFGTTEPDD
jgi:hypothetical protein